MPEIKQFSQLPRESPKLLQYLQSASEEVRVNETTLNANLRKEALELARSVVAALEQPEEVVMRWGFEVGDRRIHSSRCMLIRCLAGLTASMPTSRYRS